MHHIHYFVVQSSTGREAIDTVLANIEDWGSDNNWRTAVGAISQKTGEITKPAGQPPEASWHFAADGQGAAAISKTFQKKIDHPEPEWVELELMKRFINELALYSFSGHIIKKMCSDPDGAHLFYPFKEFAKTVHAAARHFREHPDEPFDVFKHEYRPYEYEEIGVTHIDVGDSVGEDDDLFLVLIDIHT